VTEIVTPPGSSSGPFGTVGLIDGPEVFLGGRIMSGLNRLLWPCVLILAVRLGLAGEPEGPKPIEPKIRPTLADLNQAEIAETARIVELLQRGEEERQELIQQWARRISNRHSRPAAFLRNYPQPPGVPAEKWHWLPTYTPPADNVIVGDWGLLPKSLRILQIIDDDEMLLDYRFGRYQTRVIWLKGHPTESLTDDSKFSTPLLVRATGTRDYTTVLGARSTVLYLEVVQLQPSLLRIAREYLRDGKKGHPDHRRLQKFEYRIWRDATGQFETEAQFLGMAAGKVKLRKKTGSMIDVPIERLSTEDQEWIRKQGR